MQNAVFTLKKIENFISDCDNYVRGKLYGGCVDESSLLQVCCKNANYSKNLGQFLGFKHFLDYFSLQSLNETRNEIYAASADNFNTPEAIRSIVNLTTIGNKMLNQKSVDKILKFALSLFLIQIH